MEKYILDTNVYIEAYKGYYHPDIVPVYWDILKKLGEDEIIVSPIQVRNEIKIQNKPSPSDKTDNPKDRFLYDWSRSSDNKCFIERELKEIPPLFFQVQKAYENVKFKNTEILKKKSKRFTWPRREPVSDQDMFVIATVLFYKKYFPGRNYILVTKENNDSPPKYFKPAKIPHICDELNIQWMNDFDFVRKVGIVFDSSNFIIKS